MKDVNIITLKILITPIIIIFVLCISLYITYTFTQKSIMKDENKKVDNSITNMNKDISKEGMLLVLAAPSIHDEYYKEYFDKIVTFQIEYAKKIIKTGTDEVRILVDTDTRRYYMSKLPESTLIEEGMYDIWMRDFTTVNPESPVQFIYTDASMSKLESVQTQNIFNRFVIQKDLTFAKTDFILDGGNIVDNYNGKVITTTRFLEDNNVTYTQAKKVLKKLLNATEVAIIEPDDEVLAHADGMVAWIDDDVLAVNDYSKTDPQFHALVLEELEYSFPNTKIITVPVTFDEGGGVDNVKGIGSACGINLNLVATYKNLYVPVFGTEYEKEVLEIIKKNTSKNVVTVNAKNICLFGGSVRCTTWQLVGGNTKKLLR